MNAEYVDALIIMKIIKATTASAVKWILFFVMVHWLFSVRF